MLNSYEIRVLFHLIDSVDPDLERKRSGRYELKPVEEREYISGLSYSEEEYRVFKELRKKLERFFTGNIFRKN